MYREKPLLDTTVAGFAMELRTNSLKADQSVGEAPATACHCS
jgi:hypothetical protein